MTTKLDPNLIVASGTPSSSTYLCGDGSWTPLILPPIWVTQAGSIAISNEQISFSTNLVAADPAGLALTYSIVSGALPSGLTMDNSGVIAGTVTRVFSNTVSSFTVSVTNGSQAKQRAFSITVNNNINEAPNWSTASGSIGAVNMGSVFNYNLSAVDPNGDAVTYLLVSGSLPTGLSMNSSGVITGTAATVGVTTVSTFTVRAVDIYATFVERTFSITVNSTTYYVTNSLRIDHGNKVFTRTPSINGNQRIWTLSMWVKMDVSTNYDRGTLLHCSSPSTVVEFSDDAGNFVYGTGKAYALSVYQSSGTQCRLETAMQFRDPSAWYHVVVSMNTTASVCNTYINGVLQTYSGHTTQPTLNYDGGINSTQLQSLFNHSTSAQTAYSFGGYVADVYLIDGAALTPTSFGKQDINGNWIPIQYVGPGNLPVIGSGSTQINPTGSIFGNFGSTGNGVNTNAFDGNDTAYGSISPFCAIANPGIGNSAWLGKAFSSPTPLNKVEIISASDYGFLQNQPGVSYTFNLYGSNTLPGSATAGTLVASVSGTDQNEKQTATFTFTTTTYQYWWVQHTVGIGNTWDIAELKYYSPYTSTTSIYGTNGFHLEFKNSANLGLDTSGNGNNWTVNGFTSGDQMIDTPTNNYCTLSPIDKSVGIGPPTNGNLIPPVGGGGVTKSTMWVTSGKWYWEVKAISVSGGQTAGLVATEFNADVISSSAEVGSWSNYTWGWNMSSAQYRYPYNAVMTYGTPVVTNDITMFAFDADAKAFYIGKNGTWFNNGDPVNGIGALSMTMPGSAWTPAFTCNNGSYSVNFGQVSFVYTPPENFNSMCTNNLPAVPITSPSNYFNPIAYTGTGGTQVSKTGVGFQPDLVWIKGRSAAYYHTIVDSVRLAINAIRSDQPAAETAQGLVSIDVNGFTLPSSSQSGWAQINDGHSYVAWNWKKGSTPGFDIVTYAGNGSNRTISHSVGVTPKMIMVKDRTASANWHVYHASYGFAGDLMLNQISIGGPDSTLWNNTPPTSSVFSLGTSPGTNANGDNYVAYLWAEVPGFSKFGSYTGNSNNDGPFIYCGFKPRFIMVRDTGVGGSGHWYMMDSTRNTYNEMNFSLRANTTILEQTINSQGPLVDFVSNGFKFRGYNEGNGSLTYIYCAFAEIPFGGSNVSPATAR